MVEQLPPRERQIVDILYAAGEATVAEVRAALPVELSQQAVRAMLTRLEGKGFVKRRRSQRGFVFSPAVAPSKATHSALKRLVDVFFGGSTVGAASALLGMTKELDEHELEELERMIARAKKAHK
jgi:predicted transcriptional regulator